MTSSSDWDIDDILLAAHNVANNIQPETPKQKQGVKGIPSLSGIVKHSEGSLPNIYATMHAGITFFIFGNVEELTEEDLLEFKDRMEQIHAIAKKQIAEEPMFAVQEWHTHSVIATLCDLNLHDVDLVVWIVNCYCNMNGTFHMRNKVFFQKSTWEEA